MGTPARRSVLGRRPVAQRRMAVSVVVVGLEVVDDHVYPPGLITVSDVQLLEGMADFALSVPQGPGDDRNMTKLLAGWRHAVIAGRFFPANLPPSPWLSLAAQQAHRGQQPRGDGAPRRETKLGAPKNLS